jgi:hypothetical protein
MVLHFLCLVISIRSYRSSATVALHDAQLNFTGFLKAIIVQKFGKMKYKSHWDVNFYFKEIWCGVI